jgi:hypothetical protein
MSKSSSFLSKVLPADRVETPSDGERRYTLPLAFDPADPDGFNVIREVQEHLAALQVQQWAWKKLEELRKLEGVEKVAFLTRINNPTFQPPTAVLTLKGVRARVSLKTIKDARVAPAQVEPIHAHNLQALQEWMEGLELFFPSSFTALEMVEEAFCSQKNMTLDQFEQRILATLPKPLQAEVARQRLDQELPVASASTKPRM